MEEEKIKQLLKELEKYNIYLISFDNLGDVNIDDLKVEEEYLFDVLEEI